ncbi:MAG: hypothetical protein WCX73_05135 [Candidatus Pacearchaeota archaeon]|jgi:hypothetical protein
MALTTPIFISPFFLNYILPFVLVFTLIFAILQKTKILGEEKKQIDAMISLVIGLILISFGFARDMVVQLMPFLAVSVAILLVFMLFYGFIYGRTDKMQNGIKIALLIIGSLALVTVVLIISGAWDYIYSLLFERAEGGQILINILLLVVIAGAIIAVVSGKGGKSSSSDD